ncbi:tyrosine--tRNA (Tyr) ligase [Parastagonospora nodorum]|nr:tyrosine--tRNA (Tyr) ligase [Parastagonospora nodorum]KAH3982843.1 tyrosine--tRNA (Tyr) ligase [Parastagonospora nodorum]KAH4061001.1 tyrosine--tRNA (Tyr) ligase [Parastagonospora nodorum]KAH4135379.1 tyrosine--tRNA (Tyr) ligase [Parastagonospora nodorum]KAH4170585.1 tyrosine--tRNA (Tyr) ligase [Parastagonospora nodorum]
MSLLRHLPRRSQYVCRQCIRKQSTSAQQDAAWAERAGTIRAGAQQSMLSVLEERGFVKDVAGERKTLDWVLTEKPIGAYVGVDPTAPSLHVGHLLPFMALFWMYLHGYNTFSLLGGGTATIGDPSGRTTARSSQAANIQRHNSKNMHIQLRNLWTNVKCLGIKHQYSNAISWKKEPLNNETWLQQLSAIDLMRGLGSGMRLGAMLARDSVKVRMENGEGMAMSEFSYPLFQAYDWWHMYQRNGVQLQIGGSDQYGNICAGMDAISYMRRAGDHHSNSELDENPLRATYGLTTPLLTTASGEKFGKSAGNAVWLDPKMLSSFDLYQYFVKTADNDVERYLKLFTFLPINQINLLMAQQRKDESKRLAQHILAKEIVELAHGAKSAKMAEEAHKEAFSHGTNTFSLGALRNSMSNIKPANAPNPEHLSKSEQAELAHKESLGLSANAQESGTTSALSKQKIVTLPKTLLQPGSFPRILCAAGLASSRSEAHRLIACKGAYVVVPNSGSPETPTALQWINIEAGATVNPSHYLVDWDALVLRSGKSKIQICHIVTEEQFEAEGLTCHGWEEFKAKREKDESKARIQTE